MAQRVTLAVLLCCAAVAVQARPFTHTDAARQLQQAVVNTRCPAGCASDGCVLDATNGGYKCMRCLDSFVVNPDDGTCGCPAGRYIDTGACTDCPKGSWCAGGKYDGANAPASTTCGNDLTTLGKRAISIKACVNMAGTFYSVDGSGNPSATACPVNTYGPGLRKQRACVPCPPGYTTNNVTKAARASACVVPEGYYLKGPGQIAPCPQGEYKSGFDPAPACTKCATGVSTKTEASISESNCTEVLPTYYPADIQSGIVKSTAKCPQKYYCPGGSPTAKFDVSQTNPNTTGTTVMQCLDGTWTEGIGAASASQCMTPPGHFTANSATTPCPDGQYRADWKPAAVAGSCNKCGDNIMSAATEQISVFAIDTAVESKTDVRATAGGCYIQPGQGMYFSPASNAYRAVNCSSNNYGVANATFGLAAYPCRECPAGMETSATASTAYKADNGYVNPLACVTKAGFGWNGRVATKCPAGSYNAAGNYGTCTQCAPGLSTVDNATVQVSSDACVMAIGFGYYNNQVMPCPVGTYRDALGATANDTCTACPDGLTTPSNGGRSSVDCNVCKPGYGNTNCATLCGGSGASATFGPSGRSSSAPDNACQACPAMSSGFSFDYQAQNQNFTPAVVARSGAESAADCLAEFAQINDAAWYMGGAVNLTTVAGASTFQACVDDCKGDITCQYITFDYDGAAGAQCAKKVSNAAGAASGDVVAFKAVVAGDTTAASIKRAAAARPTAAAAKQVSAAATAAVAVAASPKGMKAKSLASGSYTFWKEPAAGIGASTAAAPAGSTASIQACLSACDDDADCAAVSMTGITSATAAPATCNLIKGDPSIAVFKRSVTKAVTDRLMVTAAL